MRTLEDERVYWEATQQDGDGRYYRLKPDGDRNVRVYGYTTSFAGLYVCFTCGHVCECGDDIAD